MGFFASGQATYSAALPAFPPSFCPTQKRTSANARGALTTSCQGRQSTARRRCGPRERPVSRSGAERSLTSTAGSLSTMRCRCGDGPPGCSGPSAYPETRSSMCTGSAGSISARSAGEAKETAALAKALWSPFLRGSSSAREGGGAAGLCGRWRRANAGAARSSARRRTRLTWSPRSAAACASWPRCRGAARAAAAGRPRCARAAGWRRAGRRRRRRGRSRCRG